MKGDLLMKRISAFIISIILIIMVSNNNTTIYGSEKLENSNINQKIEKIVLQFYDDLEYEIIDITPIYDEENSVCEYAIDIGKDNNEYGYLIYDIELNDITKFKIDIMGKSFWHTKFECDRNSNKLIRKIDEFTYILEDIKDEGSIYMASKTDIDSIFLDDISIEYSTYVIEKERYIPKKVTFGEEYITKVCKNNYCCAAVAILNVLGQLNCYDIASVNSVNWAYSTIYSMGNVKKMGTDYVMDRNQIGGVTAMFAKWYGNKTIPYSAKKNPKLDYFIDAVDKKYSSILGISTKSQGGVAGHAVSVIGYLKLKPIVYGSNKCYLAVASGWGKIGDIEYILYDKINVLSTYGVVFQYK